jgi:hypothetical protein
MGTQRVFDYTEPKYGESGRHGNAVLDLAGRDQADGTSKAVIVANAAGRGSSRVDATGPVDDAINGRRTSFRTGLVGAFLAAAEPLGETDLAVDDDTGFSDGDPVAIFNSSTEGVPTSPEYALVDGAPAADVITISPALVANRHKGARIVNLAGRAFDVALGVDGRGGVKSQIQAPNAVSIAVSEVVATDIRVLITGNSEDEATHFDTYVRTTKPRKIEPGWIPDDADRTAADAASAFDVSTFGGGADCVPDGTGGAILSAGTYYVVVVARNGAGRRDIDESGISNIEAITMA